VIGYKLVAWEPDRAMIVYDVAKGHLNRTNRLHGGIIASLCDTAGGYCGVYCDTPGETLAPVTLSLTVNFCCVRLGRACHGRRPRASRRQDHLFSDVEVCDEDGSLVTTTTGTFRYVSATPAALARSADR
jgi:uncharacterized protein (TIGR00369 family)